MYFVIIPAMLTASHCCQDKDCENLLVEAYTRALHAFLQVAGTEACRAQPEGYATIIDSTRDNLRSGKFLK